jgi:phosphoglycolate phosphatase
VSTAGAGQRALERAFEQVFGVREALQAVEIAGRTDPLIVRDALARHGIDPRTEEVAALRSTYCAYLPVELRRSSGSRVLPGVLALLASLSARADVVVGLLTGNYATSARLKLEHHNLWKYFAVGAFGDDAPDRNGLVPVAVARACGQGYGRVEPAHTVVIGDTRHDVACAKAAGARCLAVATGRTGAAHLHSAGADEVFEDLSDTPLVLAAIDALLPPMSLDS